MDTGALAPPVILQRDLIAQLRGKPLGQRLLLPSSMLRYHQNVFLDDVTVEQVGTLLSGGVNAGANEIYSVSYYSSGYDDAYDYWEENYGN